MSAEPNVDKMQEVVDYVTHHVLDGHAWSIGGIHLDFAKANLPPWFTLSGLMGMLGAGFLCWLYCKVYDQKARVPRGITNFLETIVVFVRDEIAIANLGKKDGREYAWIFLTQFTLILTLNFMGLIPLFSTATGVLGVTGALAFTTFAAMVYLGIDRFGFVGFFKNFIPHGIPLPVLILLVPIEIAGIFIKSIVLAIRLFANMLAGHIVLFALIGLVYVFGAPALPALLGALFVFFLEMLVAFLQAYIFTMLSAIFVGQVLHPEH